MEISSIHIVLFLLGIGSLCTAYLLRCHTKEIKALQKRVDALTASQD